MLRFGNILFQCLLQEILFSLMNLLPVFPLVTLLLGRFLSVPFLLEPACQLELLRSLPYLSMSNQLRLLMFPSRPTILCHLIYLREIEVSLSLMYPSAIGLLLLPLELLSPLLYLSFTELRAAAARKENRLAQKIWRVQKLLVCVLLRPPSRLLAFLALWRHSPQWLVLRTVGRVSSVLICIFDHEC